MNNQTAICHKIGLVFIQKTSHQLDMVEIFELLSTFVSVYLPWNCVCVIQVGEDLFLIFLRISFWYQKIFNIWSEMNQTLSHNIPFFSWTHHIRERTSGLPHISQEHEHVLFHYNFIMHWSSILSLLWEISKDGRVFPMCKIQHWYGKRSALKNTPFPLP
jgi:hypothetical protein